MSFVGILIFMLCVYLRPSEWVASLIGIQIMAIIVILTIFFLLVEIVFLKKSLIKAPQNIFMVLFLFTLLLSHLSHAYFGGALVALADFSKNLIIYFVIINTVNTLKKFKVYMWLLIILSLVLSIQGIIQFRTGFGLGGVTLVENRIRALGIFNDPNDLALSLVMVSPFALMYIFGNSSFFKKIINLIILGVLLYGVYLTNSRGGVIALMITFLFFFIKTTRNFFVGLVIGLIFVTAIFFYGPSRLSSLSTQEASAYGRIDAWYQGIQMIKSSPIFGVGYGMFTADYRSTAHNSFLLACAEAGFLGLFFWIGLIYFSFKELSLIQKKDAHLKSYGRALQAGLVGFLSAAFFLSRTYEIFPYLFFALSVALFNIAKQNQSCLEIGLAREDIKNIGLVSFGILVLTYLVMKVSI